MAFDSLVTIKPFLPWFLPEKQFRPVEYRQKVAQFNLRRRQEHQQKLGELLEKRADVSMEFIEEGAYLSTLPTNPNFFVYDYEEILHRYYRYYYPSARVFGLWEIDADRPMGILVTHRVDKVFPNEVEKSIFEREYYGVERYDVYELGAPPFLPEGGRFVGTIVSGPMNYARRDKHGNVVGHYRGIWKQNPFDVAKDMVKQARPIESPRKQNLPVLGPTFIPTFPVGATEREKAVAGAETPPRFLRLEIEEIQSPGATLQIIRGIGGLPTKEQRENRYFVVSMGSRPPNAIMHVYKEPSLPWNDREFRGTVAFRRGVLEEELARRKAMQLVGLAGISDLADTGEFGLGVVETGIRSVDPVSDAVYSSIELAEAESPLTKAIIVAMVLMPGASGPRRGKKAKKKKTNRGGTKANKGKKPRKKQQTTRKKTTLQRRVKWTPSHRKRTA